VSGYYVKHLGKQILELFLSSQEMRLKPVATLQYKPACPHVLAFT